ncbi:hypothetical protein [Nitrincola sp.]|uniref:hypothetical protein n=1 Tax=Nitrincola sp. TaxID=1926584 RepID=UPI003A8F383A
MSVIEPSSSVVSGEAAADRLYDRVHEKLELSPKGQAEILEAITNPPLISPDLLTIATKMREDDGIFIEL